MLKLAKVAGNSMTPRFFPGDYVLALRPLRKPFQPGQVVLAKHPDLGLVLKQISHIEGDRVRLKGMNCTSIDPDVMGPIPATALLGRVIFHLRGARPANVSV